jgi:uncharacterized protein (DUF433 family)
MEMVSEAPPLASELVAGEIYEYRPLGEHVVSAVGVCDGEPTFKYTRIGVRHALELLAGGRTLEEVATAYRVPIEAVREALRLAAKALTNQARW